MRDPACSTGGGLLELIPALTRDSAARIIAGRADAPPHLFTVDWHRSCGGVYQPTFSTIIKRINEDTSIPELLSKEMK